MRVWEKGPWHTIEGCPLVVRVIGPLLAEVALVDNAPEIAPRYRSHTQVGLIRIDRSADPGEQADLSSDLYFLDELDGDLVPKAIAMAVRLFSDESE